MWFGSVTPRPTVAPDRCSCRCRCWRPSPWRQAEELVTSAGRPAYGADRGTGRPTGRRAGRPHRRGPARCSGVRTAARAASPTIWRGSGDGRRGRTLPVPSTSAPPTSSTRPRPATAAGRRTAASTRGIRPAAPGRSTLDLSFHCKRDWGFECGWSALDAVPSTTARRLAKGGANSVASGAVTDAQPVPRCRSGPWILQPTRAHRWPCAPENAEASSTARIIASRCSWRQVRRQRPLRRCRWRCTHPDCGWPPGPGPRLLNLRRWAPGTPGAGGDFGRGSISTRRCSPLAQPAARRQCLTASLRAGGGDSTHVTGQPAEAEARRPAAA